mgnify:CR=1 FL=1
MGETAIQLKPILSYRDIIDTLKRLKAGEVLRLDEEMLRHYNIITEYVAFREKKPPEEVTLEDVLEWLEHNVDPEMMVVPLSLAMGNAVVGRPSFDVATRIGQKYVKRYVVDTFAEAGWKVHDLFHIDATREKLLDVLRGARVVYVKWLGHGNASVITGDKLQRVLWVGDAEGARSLKQSGVVVFSALSCITRRGLGKWLVKQKAVKAYYGYDDVFYFCDGREEYANPFFASDMAFDRVLLEGATAGQALEVALDTFKHFVDSPSTPAGCKPYLLHDMRHCGLEGDKEAKITEGEAPPIPPIPTKWHVKLPVRAKFKMVHKGELWQGELEGVFDGYITAEG